MTRVPPPGFEYDDESDERSSSDFTEFGFGELGSPDVLDAHLDGALDRRSARFRAAFVGSRRFREDLAEMEEIVGEMKRRVRSPDLSHAVLAEIEARRPFIPVHRRRILTLGRLSAAASILLMLASAVLIERARPGTMAVLPGSTPVSNVVDAAVTGNPPLSRESLARSAGEVTARVLNQPSRKMGATRPFLASALSSLGRPVSLEIRPGIQPIPTPEWAVPVAPAESTLGSVQFASARRPSQLLRATGNLSDDWSANGRVWVPDSRWQVLPIDRDQEFATLIR